MLKMDSQILMRRMANKAKVIPLEEAELLRCRGWLAADLHVHTTCSHDVIPTSALKPEALYNKALRAGMDFVTFTDHNTVEAYDILGWEKDKLVTGVEISIRDDDIVGHTLHLNVYDFTKDQFQDMAEISLIGDLMGLLAYLNRSSLPYTYNHPFWFEPREKPNLAAVLSVMGLFPVIEYNRHRAQRKNEIVVELAQKFEKGLTATTDTHSGRVGEIYTLSKGEDFGEYFRRIREGSSYVAVTVLTKEDIVREVNAWIDLLSCQDLIQSGELISTGVSYMDGILGALTGETFRSFPRLYRYTLNLCRKLSCSGLPASLYLRSEGSLVPEIERQLAGILGKKF